MRLLFSSQLCAIHTCSFIKSMPSPHQASHLLLARRPSSTRASDLAYALQNNLYTLSTTLYTRSEGSTGGCTGAVAWSWTRTLL